jgi:hypothetical protein
MPYHPSPLPAGHAVLPEAFEQLQELLAEHVHDLWARRRIAEGWSYGPVRDDRARRHPCLVPFPSLPEVERQYDRAIGRGVVEALLAQGWRLAPPGGPAPPDSGHAPQAIEALLRHGEFLEAMERSRAGLRAAPDDLGLRLQLGQALLGVGATREAHAELLRVCRLARSSAAGVPWEALGLLGRAWKDLWETAETQPARERGLARCGRYYRRAFVQGGSLWAGINAATYAWLAGRRAEAQALARQVRDRGLAALAAAPGEPDYWVLATLGEAALLLGDIDQSADCYARAVRVGRGRWRDLAGTARSLDHLAASLGIHEPRLRDCFPAVRIGVWRGGAGVPAHGGEAPREVVEGSLRGVTVAEAAVCLFTGEDLPVPEALGDLGIPVRIVLPCRRDAFLDQLEVEGAGRRGRGEAVLAGAAEVIELSARTSRAGAMDRALARNFCLGLGRLRAAHLWAAVLPLEGRDAADALAPGGPDNPLEGGQRLGAILFADISSYSQLDESQIPIFAARFLGGVARLLAAFEPPLAHNTWGDALYFVFSDLAAAGRFALRLQAFVAGAAWAESGLPALGIRISLHAGPVTMIQDPVQGRATATGTHAAVAARLEPVTPVGQIYATQGYAALLAASGDRSLKLECKGRVPLAKGAGVTPVYRVTPGRGSTA